MVQRSNITAQMKANLLAHFEGHPAVASLRVRHDPTIHKHGTYFQYCIYHMFYIPLRALTGPEGCSKKRQSPKPNAFVDEMRERWELAKADE